MTTTTEIERKLAKLAEYEAIEAKKEKWAPYHELETKLHEVYQAKRRVDDAAAYAEEADQLCRDIGVYPSHHATDELWECSWEIDKLIEQTEKELENLYGKLEKEEEE
tara:strand:+ start:206 stop:529 length:324 start_codon:yes stop_codon:yes gene_type:complete